MTKLTAYFYDASGTSLASPLHTENPDRLLAYETAFAAQQAVSERRGIKVYLHTQEEPEVKFVTRQEVEDDS